MKAFSLTLCSCITLCGIAAFSPDAMAYQPASAPAVRMDRSPAPATPPRHTNPAPVPMKLPVPLIQRPPPVVSPSQGPNPSA